MTADQPCAGCGCEAEHDGDYGASGHPGPCPPHTCSRPPVTADHTPERLSAAEREALAEPIYEAWRLGKYGAQEYLPMWHELEHKPTEVPEVRNAVAAVERILAAHLADVEARLAAVEALADEWAADPDGLPRADVCARILRAALHPDPSE